jgi:hypothetical protein
MSQVLKKCDLSLIALQKRYALCKNKKKKKKTLEGTGIEKIIDEHT